MGVHSNNRATGKGDYTHEKPLWKGGLAVGYGELVYRDAADNYDKAASGFTWNTDLATTQGLFKAAFRGVSGTLRKTAYTSDGNETDGCILSTGEFQFPCAALGAAAYVGAYVAIAQGTGSTVDGNKVAVTTTVGRAIGKLTRDAAAGATELTFRIFPAIMDGGVQAVV